MNIDPHVSRYHMQPPLLETTFDQQAIRGNRVTCPPAQDNPLCTETRHLFDRDDLSKALNGMVDPDKKVPFAWRILCLCFSQYLFAFKRVLTIDDD
jgi:hypothetical protein